MRIPIRNLIACLSLIIALLTPAISVAQGSDGSVRLIADSVNVIGQSRLVARGNVEVLYKGQRLRASSVIYDRNGEILIIEGPIRIDDDVSGTIILADQAELGADLRNGLLISARLVLNQQVQLAAAELRRVDGRYSAMTSVVASSCKVCAGDPTPLWEIRAKRVVHDEVGQQIYFDHAQLRFAGIPVFYLPRLRMPDPTLKRSTGFLIPSLRTTSTQGLGIRLPFFWAIRPDRDLTLTPYITTEGVRSIDLRYRQAYSSGTLELRGAVSSDQTLGTQPLRGYLEIDGQFRLPRQFRLTLDLEGVTDAGYFRDYGLDERDRLVSRVTVDRIDRDTLIQGRLHGVYSLRDGDDNRIQPTTAFDATWLRRYELGNYGNAALRMQAHGLSRQSASLIDSDSDGLTDGRDVLRGSLRFDWRKDWVFGPGIQLGGLGQANVDLYQVKQDATLSGSHARTSSAFGLDLRWPFQRFNAQNGVSEVIEPVAQLVWSHRDPVTVANEDSRLVEFDQGNLFALSRFSGADVVETGFRANLGLAYSRQAPDGTHLRLFIGRVFSGQPTTGFSTASGLSTERSDYLLSADVTTRNDISLLSQFLMAESGELTKGQVGLSIVRTGYSLAAGYTHVIADSAEERDDTLSELTLDSNVLLNPNWALKLDAQYDLTARSPTGANLGLRFSNECLAVDLSLSRRFTTSTSVTPTTTLGLSVELLGFGGGAAGTARACRG